MMKSLRILFVMAVVTLSLATFLFSVRDNIGQSDLSGEDAEARRTYEHYLKRICRDNPQQRACGRLASQDTSTGPSGKE